MLRVLLQGTVEDYTERQICLTCGKSDEVYLTEVPRVFRFLAAELATMNVHLQLSIKRPSEMSH